VHRSCVELLLQASQEHVEIEVELPFVREGEPIIGERFQ